MSTDTEVLADVEALKQRFSDTKVLYREVCALLFFRHGITPTTNKLYQFVRKGTMSTPSEALARFWEELRGKARIEIDHPDLPQPIKAVAAEAIAAVWREATAAARGELAALRVELQAEQERLRHDFAQAQRELADALAKVDQLRVELAGAADATTAQRLDLEAERRRHAGTVARLEEVQGQVEQHRAQMQRQQDAFSADLAKAHEAVESAERRAAASERRALTEIEQERQARVKADKQMESLRVQLAGAQARHAQTALEHAETAARLQARCDAAVTAEAALRRAHELDERALADARAQLLACQGDAARHQAEARAVQALLDRVSLPAVPGTRSVRKKTTPPA